MKLNIHWRFCIQLCALLMLTSAVSASAQQPPPAVPANEQMSQEAAETLALARERVLADMARLPRYTCVQTITRYYYRSQSRKKGQSCADLIAAHPLRDPNASPLGWDRLRLEVAIAENTNVYSWVGAPKLEKDVIDKLAGHGPLGTGDFGPFLTSVFGHARIRFLQTRVIEGQRLFEYAYEVPMERSRYEIKSGDSWIITGYSGTFLLSREAPKSSAENASAGQDEADIVKLTVKTDELPANANACQAISDVEYSRKAIHDRMILIPRETHLFMIGREGAETSSVTVYDRCREWASTIKIHYDLEETSPTSQAAAANSSQNGLPAGVRFECRIVTPIDPEKAAAGDPFQATLLSAIHDGKHGVAAPAGTRLNGRIMRVEEQVEGGKYLQIAIRFESIELGGRVLSLRAVPQVMPRHGYMAMSFTGPVSLSPTDASAGIGSFIFSADRSVRVPREIDSSWVTISPPEPPKEPGKEDR